MRLHGTGIADLHFCRGHQHLHLPPYAVTLCLATAWGDSQVSN